MFYNRQKELNRLKERYESGEAQLLIIYGRRRVGKTELLQQFAKEIPHIYFLADLSSEKEQLVEFTERIRHFTGDPALIDNPFANWSALFAYLQNVAQNHLFVVIIDEFQYLATSNKALTSILQKAWDEGLKKTKIYLVLCGSYVSFMERELLAYKSPLYGRRTGQLLIEPLSFAQASDFFPLQSMKNKIMLYGILGGIPAYLLQFKRQETVKRNIAKNILQQDSFLFNEPQFLLMEELREPRNYFSILKAIALGATRINEIVQKSGLERGMVVKYLEVLQNLRIVIRDIPVSESRPEKSRKGLYRIHDHFFRFWFRFVLPNKSFIAENRQDFVLKERIWPFLDQFMGPVFEQVCMEFLEKLNIQGRLPFNVFKIGRHWQNSMEIDIMAFDLQEEHFLFGECKWSHKKVGTNILDELIEKAKMVRMAEHKKSFFVLFSKSGFTEAIKKIAAPNIILYDLKDMQECFEQE